MQSEQKYSKLQLLEDMEHVRQQLEALRYEQRMEELALMKKDMESEQLIVVTVGEFNNGKSTFVNALLGESLLPMGILPTTAVIHMLVYGEERALTIVRTDGTAERLPLTKENLVLYAAEGEADGKDIQYVQLTLPSPVLKQGVVLIDTPGVNDLNEARASITYGLIPRADMVLFMLNMTAPVKRTEYEFLTETLLKQGLDRITFIANYADAIDDSEEDVLYSIRRRLATREELANAEVWPLSAKEALEGKLKQDNELLELSGIEAVEQRMQQLIKQKSGAEEKLNRYFRRTAALFSQVEEDILQHLKAIKQTGTELEEGLQYIQAWFGRLPEIEAQVEAYVAERKKEINYMIVKSVDYLFDNLGNEVDEAIEIFNGSDIGHYYETHIPRLIKRRLKVWMEQYSDKINHLLQQLELEIAKGLSEAFEENIELERSRAQDLNYEDDAEIRAPELSDPMVRSGLLVGGAGAMAMLIGAPIVIPIIAMAGLPFIQKKMLKRQLTLAKPSLKQDAAQHLLSIRDQFLESVEDYVSKAIRNIHIDAFALILRKSKAYEAVMHKEKERKQQDIAEQLELQEQLFDLSMYIQNWLKHSIQKEGNEYE